MYSWSNAEHTINWHALKHGFRNPQPLLLYFHPFACTNCYVRKLDIPYTRGHVNSAPVLAYKSAGLSAEPQGMSTLLCRGKQTHTIACSVSGFITATGEKKEVQLVLIFFIFVAFLISKPLTVKHYTKSSWASVITPSLQACCHHVEIIDNYILNSANERKEEEFCLGLQDTSKSNEPHGHNCILQAKEIRFPHEY